MKNSTQRSYPSSKAHQTDTLASQKRGWILIIVLILLIVATFFYDSFRINIEKRAYPKNYHLYVSKYAAEYDLPPHLVYAVIHTESHFDSSAVSSAGAIGLMQLMPDTFRWISDDLLREYLPDNMAYDPETNIRYGCFLLQKLYNRYENWNYAIAAYNAGPGNVDAWLKDSAYTDDSGTLILSKIPYEETRNYVSIVLATLETYNRLYADVSDK